MNKGELSETYAFLYLLHFNKVNFADAELNQLKDYIKVLSLAENNYESSIKINLDKTISIIKNNKALRKVSVNEIISEASLEKLMRSIKNKENPNVDFSYLKDKLNISTLKASANKKSDFLFSFSYSGTTYEELQGVSLKSNLGANATILNASHATNIIYEVKNFEGNIDKVNSIDSRNKLIDRIDKIIEQKGRLSFLRCANDIFENNLRKVDSLMPENLSKAMLHRYKMKSSKFVDLVSDPIKKIHFTSLLKSAAFGMFPSKEWDGLFPVKGIFVVQDNGGIVIFHILKEKYLNDYLFNNAYFENASTNRHDFGKLYKEDNKLLFKLNCQLRLS